jgi:hypothetical protein
MSNPERKGRRNGFKHEELIVRAMLNQCAPIPGSPDDEYDCLAHAILSHLHRGGSREELKPLIRNHAQQHFDAVGPSGALQVLEDKIWSWWSVYRESGSRDV